MFIWIFVHLRNPINVRQIELLTIWLYSEWGEDRFVVVQHLWCRKICKIVCRVSRKWMESKFLDQDVDVVSLANKGIVIGCFVGRNYNKILMETGKLTDNIRVKCHSNPCKDVGGVEKTNFDATEWRNHGQSKHLMPPCHFMAGT